MFSPFALRRFWSPPKNLENLESTVVAEWPLCWCGQKKYNKILHTQDKATKVSWHCHIALSDLIWPLWVWRLWTFLGNWCLHSWPYFCSLFECEVCVKIGLRKAGGQNRDSEGRKCRQWRKETLKGHSPKLKSGMLIVFHGWWCVTFWIHLIHTSGPLFSFPLSHWWWLKREKNVTEVASSHIPKLVKLL